MADIKHMITIAAPPEGIHPLISTGAGLAKWWAEDVTGDAVKKVLNLGFFDRATVYQLKLLSNDALLEVDWHCGSGNEWKGTRLLFQLAGQKEQTILRFTHAYWQAETDYFLSCNTTWGALMFRLKAAAEGKSPGPLFTKSGVGY